MRAQPCSWFFAVGMAAIVAVYAMDLWLPGTLPPVGADGMRPQLGIVASDALYVLLGLAAAAALVAGVHLHRPRHRWVWYFQAAGLAVWSVGDALFTYLEDVVGDPPFPSVADAFYLASYPLMAIGLVGLAQVRRVGRDAGGLIDSLTFAVGMTAASWVFLIQPALTDTSMTLVARVVSSVYPLADIVLLGVLVWLLTGPRSRTPSMWLLAGALALLLVADTAFSVGLALGVDADFALVWVWLSVYVLWGCAALHPSMAVLSRETAAPATRLSTTRMAAVSMAAMVPAATLVLQRLRGEDIQVWAIASTWVVLFGLVMLRMAGLMRRIEGQREQLAHVARTDALTGLPNRRSADAELQRALSQAAAAGTSVAVALIDLDNFKQFNDQHGHNAGDGLLVAAARAWRASLPTSTFLARYGGEEFLLISTDEPATRTAGTLAVMQRGLPQGVTMSAGAARWDGAESDERLVNRADTALYAAKAAGRNRVEWATAEPHTGRAALAFDDGLRVVRG